MELGLKGRRVLITGGSQGIGRATAMVLAAEGCDLYLASRSKDDLEAARRDIAAAHGTDVKVFALDLSKSGDQTKLFEAARDADILINNAGAIPGGTIEDIDEATWRQAWDLKVFGYINMCRHFYPVMRERGGGVILNIIGNGGEKPRANYIAGSAGNAALMAFSRALGGNSADDGIRVVALNPGPVATDRLVRLMKKASHDKYGDESRYQEFLDPFAFNRAAKPDEIAWMAAFLVSERSAYTSGTVVTVDGGMVNRGPLF